MSSVIMGCWYGMMMLDKSTLKLTATTTKCFIMYMDLTDSPFCNVKLTPGSGCPVWYFIPSSLCTQILPRDLFWAAECVQKWNKSTPDQGFPAAGYRERWKYKVVKFLARRSPGPGIVAWRRPTCWPGAPALTFMQEGNKIYWVSEWNVGV